MVRFIAFLLVLVLFTNCTKEEETLPLPTKVNLLSTNDMLEAVNQVRAAGCQCGNKTMPPVNVLSRNAQLDNAANKHATDMEVNDFFNHKGTDGTEVGDRATAAGYSWIRIGENIAVGPEEVGVVVQLWIDSPSHCKNLMNPDYTEMGFAKQGEYWVQVFGSKND